MRTKNTNRNVAARIFGIFIGILGAFLLFSAATNFVFNGNWRDADIVFQEHYDNGIISRSYSSSVFRNGKLIKTAKKQFIGSEVPNGWVNISDYLSDNQSIASQLYRSEEYKVVKDDSAYGGYAFVKKYAGGDDVKYVEDFSESMAAAVSAAEVSSEYDIFTYYNMITVDAVQYFDYVFIDVYGWKDVGSKLSQKVLYNGNQIEIPNGDYVVNGFLSDSYVNRDYADRMVENIEKTYIPTQQT